MRRTSLLAIAIALLGMACVGGIASADERAGAPAAASDRAGETVKVRMAVSAKRFRVDGDRVYARGPMTVLARDRDGGGPETFNRRINLRVKNGGGGRCTILNLHLAELFVDLLGLEVRTSEINLQITGDGNKALGKLFCKLSEGLELDKKKLARSAAHALNRRLDGHELNVIRFRATLHPQPAPARAEAPDGPRCEILDLDIGPLQLDLLGLVVDLYGENTKSAVHVDADADPNGGVLGAKLCELAGPPA